MKKACGSRKGLSILNVGAGTGGELSILSGYASNYVIDISQDALSVIDPGLCTEKKVAPVETGSFPWLTILLILILLILAYYYFRG